MGINDAIAPSRNTRAYPHVRERCLGDSYEYHGDSVSITHSQTLHIAYAEHELSSTYRVGAMFQTIKNPSLLKVYLVPFFAMVTHARNSSCNSAIVKACG